MTIHAAWTVLTSRDFWRLVVPDVLRRRTGPMVVHYNARWVIGPIVAICLGRHVFTWRSALTRWVLDHEERHTQQYAEYGFFGYLARWFHQSLTVGYVLNRFEQEADTYADAKAHARFAERTAGFDGWFGQAVARKHCIDTRRAALGRSVPHGLVGPAMSADREATHAERDAVSVMGEIAQVMRDPSLSDTAVLAEIRDWLASVGLTVPLRSPDPGAHQRLTALLFAFGNGNPTWDERKAQWLLDHGVRASVGPPVSADRERFTALLGAMRMSELDRFGDSTQEAERKAQWLLDHGVWLSDDPEYRVPRDAASGDAPQTEAAPTDAMLRTEWRQILDTERYFSADDPVRVFVEKLLERLRGREVA